MPSKKTMFEKLSSNMIGVAGFAALLVTNVVLFLIQSVSGGATGSFTREGGLFAPAVQHSGEWWRVVSGAFLHQDYSHIFGNMMAMMVLGLLLVVKIGGQRALAAYFVGLFAAALGGIILQPETLQIGASGAIFGLAGTLCAVGWKSRSYIFFLLSGIWLAWSIYSTFITPGIAWGEHLGGALGGALFGIILYEGKNWISKKGLEEKPGMLSVKEALFATVLLCALFFYACIQI